MPAVTFDTLPLDVLDLVFQFLDEDLSDVGRTSRLKTFYRLCLVSRALLPLARHYLYSKPLAGHSRTWKSAISLALTLKQRNNASGHLVCDLVDLPSWVLSLSTSASSSISLSYQVRGQSKVYSWYLAMLGACTLLKRVGLVFSSSLQVGKVIRALSPSRPTLRTIKLQSIMNCYMRSEHVRKFASKIELDAVEQFEVTSVSGTSLSSATMPFRIQALVLNNLASDSLRQYFPVQTSALRSLTLRQTTRTPSQLLELVQRAASTLRYLEVEPERAYDTRSYRNYGLLHDGPDLLPELFSTLPKIRFLKLTSHKALSVQRLEALAANSPDLVDLVLTESVWVADNSSIDTSVRGWQASVFPEAQGAEVDYQLCTDACPSCGMVHYDW